MLTFNDKDIIDFKISLSKDLEKKIKMGYQSQFRNIVISIVSMPMRYKKAKALINVSEDIQTLENSSKNIYNYLLDMFDVFGDNAVLNAKRIFEESGTKWGKKFYKSFNQHYNAGDVKKLVKELYLSIKDIDYINSVNRQINWVFKKPVDDNCVKGSSSRYYNTIYEVKSIWLQHFINGIAPGYTCVMEIIEDGENQKTTNIIIKEVT
ncbi:MAG TPA: hypothetical protein VMV86_05165 [Methanosarcinales archaeon]|nr:hypothetical protein [Methanosarcinales archaeon]